MLDDMFDHLETLSEQPVWRPMPQTVRENFRKAPPFEETAIGETYQDFLRDILPYGGGNTHPAFFGWVQGSGTAVGMLAEMLSATMNSNVGGRDHAAVAVERQIVDWMRDIFAFPQSAGGLFMTGSSQANFVATLVARTRALGPSSRKAGNSGQLTAYASVDVHGCVPRAMEMAGLGSDNLRLIPVDAEGRIEPLALERAIAGDMASGRCPFLVIGSAGTVNTGAVDDLNRLADISQRYAIHLHVDGALGALGVLSPELSPLFAGISRADSIAFDFHKWGHVPYDAGFLLVRDQTWQLDTFASQNAYLTRAARGLAGGDWWPCDYGPDLSRSFRALKTWFTLKTFGFNRLGEAMLSNCRLAKILEQRVISNPLLDLSAPVALNVVCFSYRSTKNPSAANAWIVESLHEAGIAAPSLTLIDGKNVIRTAIVNHRTRQADIKTLIDGVLEFGDRFDHMESGT